MTDKPTITLSSWRGISVGERLALEMATAVLWPLSFDKRMTVLINLLAVQIDNDYQIDAIHDMLKMMLKASAQRHEPHTP